jgi:hypothetical protein
MSIYKVSGLGNTGDAYRRFHSAGLLGRVHDYVMALMQRKAVGGVIVLLGSAGFLAGLITFWPG